MKIPIDSVVSKVMFWKGEVRVFSETGMRCLKKKKKKINVLMIASSHRPPLFYFLSGMCDTKNTWEKFRPKNILYYHLFKMIVQNRDG